MRTVELIKLEDLTHFLSKTVKVGIQDLTGGERSPFVQKTIEKLAFCPDHTHLRIYFNKTNFFAVPLTASVTEFTTEWMACDRGLGLNYIIKMESGGHD